MLPTLRPSETDPAHNLAVGQGVPSFGPFIASVAGFPTTCTGTTSVPLDQPLIAVVAEVDMAPTATLAPAAAPFPCSCEYRVHERHRFAPNHWMDTVYMEMANTVE